VLAKVIQGDVARIVVDRSEPLKKPWNRRIERKSLIIFIENRYCGAT
jgi:hypothetical protein